MDNLELSRTLQNHSDKSCAHYHVDMHNVHTKYGNHTFFVKYSNVITAIDKIHTYLLCFNTYLEHESYGMES